MVTKEKIEEIKSQFPNLTPRGIRWYSKMKKQHTEDFLDDNSVSRITHAVYWMRLYNRSKKTGLESNSRDLKEYMDRVTESSTKSGEFILGMIFNGYTIKELSDSPQVLCNMSGLPESLYSK